MTGIEPVDEFMTGKESGPHTMRTTGTKWHATRTACGDLEKRTMDISAGDSERRMMDISASDSER